MAVIGDLVGHVGDLRFERGVFGIKTFEATGAVIGGLMFGKALANFPGEVETGKVWIFLLQLLDNPEAVQVVFKAAMTFHGTSENRLTFVAERGMAEIVGEGDGFRQVGI